MGRDRSSPELGLDCGALGGIGRRRRRGIHRLDQAAPRAVFDDSSDRLVLRRLGVCFGNYLATSSNGCLQGPQPISPLYLWGSWCARGGVRARSTVFQGTAVGLRDCALCDCRLVPRRLRPLGESELSRRRDERGSVSCAPLGVVYERPRSSTLAPAGLIASMLLPCFL